MKAALCFSGIPARKDGDLTSISGEPYLNRGISSQTTSQMLLRFPQTVAALAPSIVLIHAGTNDIGGNCGPVLLEDIEADSAIMADIAQPERHSRYLLLAASSASRRDAALAVQSA